MELRHVGILVKDLSRAVNLYRKMGFILMGDVEALRVQKMIDKDGKIFELVQGNWNPHIAVNWYRDEDGNLIELVEDL